MRFTMPMAVFGGLALIAAAIAFPQIKNQVIPEANASFVESVQAEHERERFNMMTDSISSITTAIYSLRACRD